jgi:probable HAF family extracellular repeat protein
MKHAAGMLAGLVFSVLACVGEARGQFQLISSPPGALSEWVFGMSADGGTLVGNGVGGTFFWTPQSGFEHFAPNSSSQYGIWGYGISGDGTTAVGGAGYSGQTVEDAFRFRRGGTLEILGRLPGYERGAGRGASFDGEIVVGRSTAGQGDPFGQAFRWTSTTGMVGLGYLAPGQAYSEATAISRDGSTIVGYVRQTTAFNQAFVWRDGTGMVGLPGWTP